MVSITHFGHEHPLILLKQLPPKENEIPLHCYVCTKIVLRDSEVYRCQICKNFLLHKSCAELPMEIVHTSHEHSLFLLPELPVTRDYYNFYCGLCEKYGRGFLYHCYLCDFDLHTYCAFQKRESIVSFRKDLTFYHPFHKHQLKLQPRPSSFLCDACQVEDKDLSYHCTSCNFCIHRRCAMLPSITNHDVHTHPLTLSFGLPSQYSAFGFRCDTCDNGFSFHTKIWIYYCELSRYFIHIKCMEIKKPEVEVDLKGIQLDDLPLLRLPSDKSAEPIQRFVLKKNSLGLGNDEDDNSLFIHKHPLIYSNDGQILKDENEDGDEVSCNGCLQPILSPPYYHCAECRYFLHLPCAKLPHELQHPHHPPHPLILNSKTRFCDELRCHLCRRSSNGLFFCCTEKDCNFNLDVKCASLPKYVEHESHKHPLQIMSARYRNLWYCRGCRWTISDDFYCGCDPCSYYLHVSCLLLPKTIKNRFDSKHRLKLRFPPHSYHPRPLECAECETEINPRNWLYHCEECDLSLHVYCIDYKRWWYNTSKYGQKHQISSHPHPLRYVFRPSIKSPCHSCKGDADQIPFSECETCNFHICQPCLQKKIEPSSSTR